MMMSFNGCTFCIAGPLWGESTHQSSVDSAHKGPVMQSFDVSLEVSLNKLLNRDLRGRWIKMVICQHNNVYFFSNIKTKSNRNIPLDIKSLQCSILSRLCLKVHKIIKSCKRCLSYKPSLCNNVHTAMDTGVPPIETKYATSVAIQTQDGCRMEMADLAGIIYLEEKSNKWIVLLYYKATFTYNVSKLLSWFVAKLGYPH